MRLGLISGGYPPDLDGIGDHSWWLARTLAAQPGVESPVHVFTSAAPARTAAPGVEVLPIFDATRPASFRALLSSPAVAGLDWLVLQYNPFSFGRRGYCPWVPQTLSRIRRLPNPPRLAVIFHETMVPPWPWNFAIMYCWQRPIFRALCRAADAAFVSTERWTPQVRRASPRLPVHHLPVGSNIPLSPDSYAEARRKLGIDDGALVLGLFGGAHLSRRLDWIGACLHEARWRRPSRRVVLLYVGPDGEAVRRVCKKADFIDAGLLDAGQVGGRLRAMDAMISPFVDGVSTRRGSVIAALQHGIPVATTRRAWTDRLFFEKTPRALLLSTAASAAAFASETMDWLDSLPRNTGADSECAAFYQQAFAWPLIARSLLRGLEPPGSLKPRAQA